MRSICEKFCCGKGNVCDTFCCGRELSSVNDFVSLDELWKWMKPQLEPPIWKWIIGLFYHKMKQRYNREKEEFKSDLNYFKRNSADYFTAVKNTGKNAKIEKEWREDCNEPKCEIKIASKQDIIGFIIEELRKVNEEDRDKGKKVILSFLSSIYTHICCSYCYRFLQNYYVKVFSKRSFSCLKAVADDLSVQNFTSCGHLSYSCLELVLLK